MSHTQGNNPKITPAEQAERARRNRRSRRDHVPVLPEAPAPAPVTDAQIKAQRSLDKRRKQKKIDASYARKRTWRDRQGTRLDPRLRDRPRISGRGHLAMASVTVEGVVEHVEKKLQPSVIKRHGLTFDVVYVHLTKAYVPEIDYDHPEIRQLVMAQQIHYGSGNTLTVAYAQPRHPDAHQGLAPHDLYPGRAVRFKASLTIMPRVYDPMVVTHAIHTPPAPVVASPPVATPVTTATPNDMPVKKKTPEPAPEPTTWSAKHAAEATETLAALYAGTLGPLALSQFYLGDHQVRSRGYAEIFSSREIMTILADDSFVAGSVDMTLAPGAPTAPLRPEEVLTTSAIIYFTTPRELASLITELPDHETRRIQPDTLIRAISFHHDPMHPEAAVLNLWSHAHDLDEATASILDTVPSLLVPVTSSPVLINGDAHDLTLPQLWRRPLTDPDNPEYRHLVHALLRSITHISRMEITSTATAVPLVPEHAPEPEVDELIGEETRSQRRRRLAAHARKRELATRVHVMGLQPRGSDNDTAATTSDNSDAPREPVMRQHWVSGFWRNQYYPSDKTHRMIWIDQHIRGDARLGVVTNPKVYTLTDPQPPHEKDKDTDSP